MNEIYKLFEDVTKAGIQSSGVVKGSVLHEFYKVPWKTIINGYSKALCGISKSWQGTRFENEYWILSDTITANTKKKYQIESYKEVISKEVFYQQLSRYEFKDAEEKTIQLYFRIAFENLGNWKKYLPELCQSIHEDGKLQIAAIKYSLWASTGRKFIQRTHFSEWHKKVTRHHNFGF